MRCGGGIRASGAISAFVAALATGCGGGDDDATSVASAPTSTEVSSGIALTADERRGRELFLRVGCGDCHGLSDAGTSGQVGGSLDYWMPDPNRLESVLYNGSSFGRGMPSFRETLSESEIEAVVAYVIAAAGSEVR